MKIIKESENQYSQNIVNLTAYEKNKISYIKTHVAKRLELDESEFKNNSRRREIVTMKYVASYFIRKYIKRTTYAFIGQQFNNLDHATILYGIRKVYDLMDSDKKFNEMVTKLEIEIRDYLSPINDANVYKRIIDLNKLDMLDISPEKKILFVGFSDIEMIENQRHFNTKEIKTFENTGLYFCEIVDILKNKEI